MVSLCLVHSISHPTQYGDSFIELLRLELLTHGAGAAGDRHRLDRLCVHADPNYGPVWFAHKRHAADAAVDIMRSARGAIEVGALRQMWGQ